MSLSIFTTVGNASRVAPDTEKIFCLGQWKRFLVTCTSVLATVVVVDGLFPGNKLVAQVPASPRNVIIFVADGLRPSSVNPTDAPTLYNIRKNGVSFVNSHAVFPTFTTPNAAAIATGHYPGDTGDFSNTIYTGYPVFPGGANGTPTPFIENDSVLGDIDEKFGGNFLDEEALLGYARRNGYSTAAVGKLGPTLIQDITQGNLENGSVPPPQTIIIDDSTGKTGGIPLNSDITERLNTVDLPLQAPDRSNGVSSTSQASNGFSGNNTTPGTLAANIVQQQYFADATTKAILPLFKDRGQPFVMVYWSRDPDGTQHNQGDSLNNLTPGINGPTSKAAVKNADDNLQQILETVRSLGLENNTDIFITSDHGFSTISKQPLDQKGNSTTSYAASLAYPGVNSGFLPPGFVAIDLSHALNLPLYDPDTPITDSSGKYVAYTPVDPTAGQRPRNGDGLIGGSNEIKDEPNAKVVVAANGGSDLIYVPDKDPNTVRRVVEFLTQQDYVSGLFVDDVFGSVPGALPLSTINLKGSTGLPIPAIVVNFKTFDTGCGQPVACGVEIADTGLQQGQGMHGSFSRADTYNNMAAIGPDFKRGFIDQAPVGNVDVAITLAHILGFQIPRQGELTGRVLSEALVRQPQKLPFQFRTREYPPVLNRLPFVKSGTLVSSPAANGIRTILNYQEVNETRYFDAAGFPDRTLGLRTPAKLPVTK